MSQRITLASEAGDASLTQISTPGLGDHSYVVNVHDLAVVIDPQRDHGRFSDAVDVGSTLVAVFETHIHNDYVSGGPRLAARHDADYVLPRDSGATVPHVTIGGRDVYELGQWRIEAIHTPGHTPHHVTYALIDPTGVRAIFSGGSMLVGAVGRCDLVAPELTDELTRAQHASVRGLAFKLPSDVVVGPTHGAGSFCSASATGGSSTSTIDAERRHNPAVLIDDVDEFVAAQIGGARRFPSYYENMAPINRIGGDDVTDQPVPILSIEDVDTAVDEGAVLVDLRPASDFAAASVPGSINIPMSDDVATYAAWVIRWGIPLVLAGAVDDAEAVRLQLARIGHDVVVGAFVGGPDDWVAADRPVQSYRVADPEALEAEAPALVLDVRDPVEVRNGAVPGSLNIHVADLGRNLSDIPNGDPWVYCASGYRASIAASVLAALGRQPTLVLGSPAT